MLNNMYYGFTDWSVKMSLKFNTDHEESEDLLSAALHVEAADNEDDDDRPPQDGMAYLRQVIKVNYSIQCFFIFLSVGL